MSAHTPGPWEAIAKDNPDPWEGTHWIKCAQGALGYWRGHKQEHTDSNWVLNEADAHLISAAPELRESAKELAAHVREMCRCLSIPEPAASLERYEAAIAKAGGAA
jgi:hypothetical protein